MRRFQRVLLFLEGGECDAASARVVEDLVRRNGAELTLFCAVDEPETEQLLATIAAGFDVDTVTHVETCDPVKAIGRRVVGGEADLVVTLDDESPPSWNTGQLLRTCPCPVWVVRPTVATLAPTGWNVVAAVDPTSDASDLDVLILELASSMVERAGGVLHVAHAWEMIGSVTRPGRRLSGRFDVTYDELIVQARAQRADMLDEMLDRIRPFAIERQVHLAHGAPESAIPRVLDDVDADVLVMGTLARTGIRRFMIGNTAERVLGSARCSLMAVKPPGFVSPFAEQIHA